MNQTQISEKKCDVSGLRFCLSLLDANFFKDNQVWYQFLINCEFVDLLPRTTLGVGV